MKNHSGYTLMEILIVLIIIAGATAASVSFIGGGQNRIRGDIRKLSLLQKKLYRDAQLYNRTYRLVFELEEEEEHRYFVESADQIAFASEENEDYDDEDDDEEEKASRLFKPDTQILKQKQSLPTGFIFKNVSVVNRELDISVGRAYIYFLPQGMSDEAVININQEKGNLAWTMVLNPLTGSSDILEGEYNARELSQR